MKFKLYEVQKCCFCIPLVTGAKLFAFIHLILCGLTLAFTITNQIRYFTNIGPRADIETINYMLQLSDVGVSLQIVVGVYLVIGLYEKNSALVLTWLLYEVTSMLIGVYLIIIVVIGGKAFNRISLFFEETIVEEGLFIAFYTFFCFTIYSLYKKFGRKGNEGRTHYSFRNDINAI